MALDLACRLSGAEQAGSQASENRSALERALASWHTDYVAACVTLETAQREVDCIRLEVQRAVQET